MKAITSEDFEQAARYARGAQGFFPRAIVAFIAEGDGMIGMCIFPGVFLGEAKRQKPEA